MIIIDKMTPNKDNIHPVDFQNCDSSKYISCILFGGISKNCNWRNDVIGNLIDFDYMDNAEERYPKELVLLNPYIDMELDMSIDSIKLNIKDSTDWDHNYASASTIKSFYFSQDGPQTMTMFELGYWLREYNRHNCHNHRELIISINKDYENASRLYSYIVSILGKEEAKRIVNLYATPKSHALAIYSTYKSCLDISI